MKLNRICKANYADEWSLLQGAKDNFPSIIHTVVDVFALTLAEKLPEYGINSFTLMPDPSDENDKRQALQKSGTFNPRHEEVRHVLFNQSEFFDRRDLAQLKYETLRALQKDGYSIAQAASEFALSRPTIYQAQTQFEQQGMEGLLPRKRGPRHPHKLTSEVLDYLQELREIQPVLTFAELARRLHQRFQVQLHPRTIEKALKARAKRGRQTP